MYDLDLIELAGGKPALHPERKGQLNRSKLKNWIEKNGGLPTYINSVATAILRENPGWSISRVIATAVNWAKKTCTTGTAFGGKVKVSSAVQRAACKAVAEWNAKKSKKAAMEFDEYLLELSSEDDSIREAQWEARMRKSFRDAGEVPDLIEMSDELYFRFIESEDYSQELVELSWDFEEEVDVNNVEAFMHVMELSAGAQSAIMTPMNMSTAQHVGNNIYKKEILSAGEIVIDQEGNKFDFSPQFLKDLKKNFDKQPLDYVPLLYTNDKDQHVMSADPKYYGGTIQELSLDDDSNPQKLFATFNLDDKTAELVRHNPKYGVSVTAHPNFVDYPRSTYYGPTLLNVAASHYPKKTKMSEWQKVGVMASQEQRDYELINLSMNYNDDVKEDDDMAGETDKPLELSSEMLVKALESDAAKSAIADAVAAATKEKDDEIQRLSSQMGNIESKGYEQLVTAALAKYNTSGDKGVPPVLIDYASALLLSFGPEERDETIKLSTGEGDKKEDLELNKVELVTKFLDETQGLLNLSSEAGSSEDNDEPLDDEKRNAGVNFLLEMTGNPVASK